MFEEFKNAFQKRNNAHSQLIIINVAIYLTMVVFFVFTKISSLEFVFEAIYNQFSIPPKISEFITRPWTLFTYSFAHSITDIFHILFNMLALYWFGKLFVEYLGSDKLIALYVLGGLAGGLLYLLMFNTIPYFVNASGFNGMVGASAAVYAIMVATATLLPDYTFFLLFLGPVRIKYIVLFYIVVSFLGSVGPNAGGNIAHLGGALIGFVYMKQLQAGVNWGGWITATLDWFRDLFGPKQHVKITYRKEKKASSTVGKSKSQISQDEIDAILDKISAGGYESLSKEEKEKLFNASKK
ncbi:MAG: rhomboid family intramembrane serine protease [Cyclobacteriaceae bacterium]|jgi:membrane associated rhomboid family serine protease|nr:rhomboid family intramembrane serine protease [Cyclobacteriaceae bacterium]